MTFSNGLRALVRQDPDIMMVGEIRDEETASLAVNASLTGHLVLSTLHTNSAAGALPRLLDMKIEAFLLASTINLLVAQRLVRQLCKECKKQGVLGADIIPDLEKIFNIEQLQATLVREKALPKDKPLAELTVYTPVGCKACNEGYKGRLGIYEALEFTDEIRALITPKTSSQELEQAGREKANLVLMIEDGFLKVAQGVTSIEEVLRVAKS
jgi:type II secretory ATPase GspE/PulE/Tfp pilus assembly ATPase PilB-like protein